MHVFLVLLLFILANIRDEFSQAVILQAPVRELSWKTGYTDSFLRGFMQSLQRVPRDTISNRPRSLYLHYFQFVVH
jgi:hypothetical protein